MNSYQNEAKGVPRSKKPLTEFSAVLRVIRKGRQQGIIIWQRSTIRNVKVLERKDEGLSEALLYEWVAADDNNRMIGVNAKEYDFLSCHVGRKWRMIVYMSHMSSHQEIDDRFDVVTMIV